MASVSSVSQPRLNLATASPRPCERLRLAPSFLMAGRAAPRLARLMSAWAKQDPTRPHSHLGPVAVDPDLQGRGIGSRLLADYCLRLDRTRMLSYLETDKHETFVSTNASITR